MTTFWNKDVLRSKQQYLLLGMMALLGIVLLLIGSRNDADGAVQIAPVGQAQTSDTMQMNTITAMAVSYTHLTLPTMAVV